MNLGGPAVLVSELIHNLPAELIDHTLITGVCENDEVDYLESHPLNSSHIYVPQMGRSISLLDDLKGFLTLCRMLRKLRPDIVHTHTSKAGVLGRLAAMISTPGARRIHTFHGHLLYGYFSKYKLTALILVEKILSIFSFALIAVSRQVREDLVGAGIGRNSHWLIIPPGIAAPEMNLAPEAKHEELSIVWIGRFTKIKNPLLALNSFKDIPYSSRGKVKFTMVGDGDLLSTCKDFAKEFQLEVQFTGWRDSAFEDLAEADLLLMTSDNEGMPVVILEAASQQVPTLTTNVGGVTEFVKDQETGYLVESDAHLISETIQRILRETENRKLVGVKARELYLMNFTDTAYAKRHLELYTSIGKRT